MSFRVFTAAIIGYACYLGWGAFAVGSAVTGLWAAVFLACGVTLWMSRPWARFLWYGLASLTVAEWLWYAGRAAASGWVYPDVLRNVLSFLPGAFLLIYCIGGSFLVRRHFARRSPA